MAAPDKHLRLAIASLKRLATRTTRRWELPAVEVGKEEEKRGAMLEVLLQVTNLDGR